MCGVSPVIERREAEVGGGAGQPLLGKSGAGEHAATEPCSYRAARGFEPPPLFLVDQVEYVDGALGIGRRLAQFQWKLGQSPSVCCEKGPPRLDLRRLFVQTRRVR